MSLRRVPLKRGSGRLRPFSAKRQAQRQERREFVERILTERPTCEAMFYLRQIVNGLSDPDQRVVVEAMRSCTHKSTEVHEPLSRARGGSITDEDNALALCHRCHSWTTTHPRLATMAGLLKSRWQK